LKFINQSRLKVQRAIASQYIAILNAKKSYDYIEIIPQFKY